MDWEQYLKKEIENIKNLKNKGLTDQEILDKNEFSYDALKAAGLTISYLVPTIEGQKMTLQEWNTHTSTENKWELFDGVPFGEVDERDRIMLGLIYSSGLKHLLDILPKESKRELVKLISNLGD